jgi:hypothetical protein|tara:strand:- start:60 stop:977 length:918 start_codon:yes stop_codon:yes gene_type:complete
MDCMVLQQFYPLNGVRGVDELPVYGDEVEQYRTAIGASFDDEIIFKKVMKSRGKAKTWFVPGDIICRRIGLEEDRCDLLRPMRDRVYSTHLVDVSQYELEIEEARREAIEGHKWKVHRNKTLLVVVDPQGRAFVVARKHWGDRFDTLMEQLCPMLPIHQVVACAPYRVAASWCAFKTMHRYGMDECSGKMTTPEFLKCMHYAEDIYNRRVALKNRIGSGRIIKMYKYRNPKFAEYWDRCFKLIDDGAKVPQSVGLIRAHFCARWVAVSPDEMDWYLSCMWWPEWKRGGPVRFQSFNRGYGGRMWK